MQTISAQKREILGKNVKNLRKDGLMPAVIYGNKKESTPIVVKEKEFVKAWKLAGESSVLQIEVDGKKENVIIHDIAFDPLKDNPIHADFLAIEMNKPIKVDVKINFVGESPAVKMGGSLVKVLHELNIEALPSNLPQEISIDISLLSDMGSLIKIEDIKISGDFKILNNPADIVVLVEAPKTEEELKIEEGETKSIEDIEVVKKEKKIEEEEEKETEKKPKE